MQKKMFLSALALSALLPFTAAAQMPLRDALQTALGMYETSPEAGCSHIKQAVDAQDLTFVVTEEAQQAYYLLATCAYQAGDMEQARDYYEKVVELDPVATRPRLDLGTVYLQQGLFLKAEEQYEDALRLTDKASPDKEQIASFLDRLPSKLQTNYQAGFGIGYDSNVNSGPEENTHLLFGIFNFTLDPDSESKGDFFAQTSLAANFSKVVDMNTQLLLGLSAIRNDYIDESDFSSQTYSVAPALRKIWGNTSVLFRPYATYQTLDEQRYYLNTGMNVAATVKLDDTWTLSPSVRAYHEDFADSPARNGNTYELGGTAVYTLDEDNAFWASAFYGYTEAKSDVFSKDNYLLGTAYNRRLTEMLSSTLSYTYQVAYYEGEDPAYMSARNDYQHQVSGNLNYSLQALGLDTTFLGASVSYNKKNSNHSMQENDRVMSLVRIVHNF